jgi:Cu+-exporting ATPase
MVGTGKGAEYGILFRNAESIETAHTVDTVIMDKTGTATEGRPSVTGIYPAAGISEKELIVFAARIEKQSEHPLASAIMEKYRALSEGTELAELAELTQLVQIPGQGIQAVSKGKTVLAGNERMMKASGIDISAFDSVIDGITEKGQTPLFFAEGGKLLGVISAADTIKPTSPAAVAALQQAGIAVILLSGDTEGTAQAIGRELGITTVIAGVLPQEKEAEVRRLQEQGRKVAMIGDGINDAPALARSDVGIAIGAGTDIAIESADIVLMKSDLMDAVTALKLSRAVIRNIRQNLFWAFFYNVLGIPLAAGVFYLFWGWKLNPLFASAAMSLSSLFVVTNALRLNLFKPERLGRTEPAGAQKIKGGAECIPLQLTEESKGVSHMKALIKIEGMSCNNCRKHAEAGLNALPGVQAQVDLESATATVKADRELSKEELVQAVSDAGYTAVSVDFS